MPILFSKKKKPALDPQEYRLFKLLEKVNLTPLTTNSPTYRFRFALPTPEHTLDLPIGKHMFIRFKDAEGRQNSRPYTPITHNTTKGYFDLTVKLYPVGKMSQHLQSLEVGQSIEIRGPVGSIEYTGPGTIKTRDRLLLVNTINMIAGGTGLTPMYQIATHIFANSRDRTKINLIYANQTVEDILMYTELQELQEKHQNFNIYYTINHPTPTSPPIPADWKGGVGFVTTDMIKQQFTPPTDLESIVLLCGPPPMMTAMEKNLIELGYPEERYFKF